MWNWDKLLSKKPVEYKREGFAQTRDALVWAMLFSPKFKFGLTLDQVLAGLDHGYQSVRTKLGDAERVAQWDESRRYMLNGFAALKDGRVIEGKQALQKAHELFAGLRRMNGREISPQRLAETEHGANELDEQ